MIARPSHSDLALINYPRSLRTDRYDARKASSHHLVDLKHRPLRRLREFLVLWECHVPIYVSIVIGVA
jgi:hypothetical protein